MSSILPLLSLLVILAATVPACGERRSDSASPGSAAAPDSATFSEGGDDAPSETDAAESGDAGSHPLTVDDIDRWEKGMAAEMQLVQAAAAKVNSARSIDDKIKLLDEVDEGVTASAGARAAGLDEARYSFVRRTLSDVLNQLTPLQLSMDSSVRASYLEQRAPHEAAYLKEIASTVPPEVVEALRARVTELGPKDSALIATRQRVVNSQYAPFNR